MLCSRAFCFLLMTAIFCRCVNAAIFPSPEVEDGIEEPCLALNGMDVLDGAFSPEFPDLRTLFGCSTRVGPIITHFAGNTSLETFETVCSDTALISFSEEESVVNMTTFGLPFICTDTLCVFYSSMGQEVLLSVAISLTEVDTLATTEGIEVPFLLTTVLFDFEEDMVEDFATSLAAGFVFKSPFLLRAIAFLATSETTCPFPVDACPCAENCS